MNYHPEATLELIPWPKREADRLDKAADIIETRGWCRGQLTDARGRVCAVAAYEMVTGAGGGYGFPALSVLIGPSDWDARYHVANWNDSLGPGAGSYVVETFRTAARELRKIADSNHV